MQHQTKYVGWQQIELNCSISSSNPHNDNVFQFHGSGFIPFYYHEINWKSRGKIKT